MSFRFFDFASTIWHQDISKIVINLEAVFYEIRGNIVDTFHIICIKTFNFCWQKIGDMGAVQIRFLEARRQAHLPVLSSSTKESTLKKFGEFTMSTSSSQSGLKFTPRELIILYFIITYVKSKYYAHPIQDKFYTEPHRYS